MRYTPQHKQQTRERILKAAARQFREKGFAGAGVSSVMKEADLTHGGFYAHFKSKDDLVAEVIRDGFDQVSERFEAAIDHLPDAEWLRAWVWRYLSAEHRAHTAEGCPMPALAAEIGRSGPNARAAFTELAFQRLDKVTSRIDAPKEEGVRRALAAVSQMAGALMLSRAFDEPLATHVREAAAQEAYSTLMGAISNPDLARAPEIESTTNSERPSETNPTGETTNGPSR